MLCCGLRDTRSEIHVRCPVFHTKKRRLSRIIIPCHASRFKVDGVLPRSQTVELIAFASPAQMADNIAADPYHPLWEYDMRQSFFSSAWLVAILVQIAAYADDWPTYHHDFQRSGVTSEAIQLPLSETWRQQSPAPPRPAWDEPAIWDGYNKVYDLKNRQVFDKALHPIIVENRVFFGSSVDDQVYCLDCETGKVIWRYFTEGPVRLAPTWDKGFIYVGSDDGNVYCINADDGQLIWKTLLSHNRLRVPGNGRVISMWPVRTGVIVMDDIAYACSGVFPSETVYLSALHASDGTEVWRSEMKDFPAQGYLLASASRLYVTTGRNRPLVFDRESGKRLYQVKGGAGGTYALLTGDTLVYGPGKTGKMAAFAPGSGDQLATFGGNHMVVIDDTAYLHTDTELTRLERDHYLKLAGRQKELAAERARITAVAKKAKTADTDEVKKQIADISTKLDSIKNDLAACVSWKVECDCPYALIVAGETVIVGGHDSVAIYRTTDGVEVWRGDVDGNAFGLAVANGHLMVSTDQGVLHCFAHGDAQVLSAGQVSDRHETTKSELPPVPSTLDEQSEPSQVLGPFITSRDMTSWSVEWTTDQASVGSVEVGPTKSELHRVPEQGSPTTSHHVLINDLPRDRIHKLRVGGTTDSGEKFHTRLYDFDTMLHYPPPRGVDIDSNAVASHGIYGQAADLAIQSAGVQRGYAFVIDGTGDLARELAARSRLQVVVVQPDATIAASAREKLHDARLYGTRVTVQSRLLDKMSYGPFLANIVMSDPVRWRQTRNKVDCQALYDILKPAGGVMIVGGSNSNDTDRKPWSQPAAETWCQHSVVGTDRTEWQDREFGQFLVVQRGKLPGAGEWTHQYGLPDNTSCSQDDLIRGDLSVLWWGRPGPRPMPDRGPRNPAPVSANGRLYVQGNRTLFGIDSYNGTILWFQQIPSMRRANIPRDGSNMVATDDFLYLALHGHCIGIAGQTGKRELTFAVPNDAAGDERQFNWGLVACHGQTLFGSAVKRGSQYLGDDGEWYEDFDNGQISRVTSARLFALERHTGKMLWQHDQGAIINSTFSLDDKAVYFVESRSKQAMESDEGRMLSEVQRDQYLVALDIRTGELLWDKAVDLSQCEYMTYMSVANDTLIVAGTDQKKRFHTFAFGALSGSQLWHHTAQTHKTHHSGHLSHPLVINEKVYVNKQTLDLKTGRVVDEDLDFNWHGCGITSASLHTIFRRFEYHGMLDLETNKRTEFLGVRSGCWLSIIPSGGTVLAPETSAGCSCTHAVQTSLAYVPRHLLPN